MNTVERANGRWREILPQLGIETRFLTNKHGACPLCRGKDRFRFDDRDGTGSYYCNQCGAGTGVLLIRKLKGWDHKTACDEVDKIIGIGNAKPTPKALPNDDRRARLAGIERLLREAHYPDVVTGYLQKRGLGITSPVLQGHWRCPYYDGDGHFIGTYPAVIAPIVGGDGTLLGVLRTYTTGLGDRDRKKILKAADTINGGIVRLHQPIDDLGIAEGIENALAAYEMFGIPTWATIAARNLKLFEPPSGISGLHIFGDNDASYTGQEAAYALAKRLFAKHLPVEVHLPPEVDIDWLDVLNRGRRYDQA
jgi:putative DNA primase/helicase